MPAPIIYSGQDLAATTAQGGLNQYYGLADTASNTFTSATQGNLCSAYTIPAGEAYANAAYELSCAGFGTWGSTQQPLAFQMYLGTAFGSAPAIAATAFAASNAFNWSLTMRLTCADGISAWWGDLAGAVVSGGATLLPGTAADNVVPVVAVNSGSHTAAVSSALTAVIQAKWGSATGAPTMTTTKTTWRKVA
jgi:hypothetical protein